MTPSIAEVSAEAARAPTHGTTLIGAMIRLLRRLPTTRQGFTRLAGTAYGAAAMIVGARALAAPPDVVKIIVPFSLSTLAVICIGTGTWIRRRLDQRFGPRERRLKVLLQLRQAASHPHDHSPGELVIRKYRPRAENLYAFPDVHDNDGLLTQVAQLNCAAFSNSAFADSFKGKYRRNGSHQRKNPHSLMLVAHEPPGGSDQPVEKSRYIGFTHLIPISEATYISYIEGKIKDNDFNAALVCSPNEEAHAILVFSLGMDRWRIKELITGRKLNALDRFFGRIGLPPFRIGDLYEAELNLWIGFLHHLQTLLREQRFSKYPVVLLTQSFNAKVERVLKEIGFVALDELSADGERLFELRVWPSAQAAVLNR